MLISTAITSMFNGVSQQPAMLRSPSQCETSTNTYPTIAHGLRKRPPTTAVAKISASKLSGAYVVRFRHESTGTNYTVVLTDGDIAVYNDAGTSCTVTKTSGYATYLNITTPKTDFAAFSIGDKVYVANKILNTAKHTDVVSGSLEAVVYQTFSSLPAGTNSGKIYKIQGDNTNAFSAYYVKDIGASLYKEWLKPGDTYKVDATKMPWILQRTGATAFDFKPETWTDRTVGDTTTVKDPSFIGKPITDVFAFRNRLGFVAAEYTFLTKVGEFTNLWPDKGTVVLDTDPIDVSTANHSTAPLSFAVPFNRSMLFFSKPMQLQLTGSDLYGLTPETVRIDPVTAFESSTTCRPVISGNEVFFTVASGNYTHLYNYFIDSNTMNNNASDITGHVPKYITGGAYQMQVSSAEDLLLVLTNNSPKSIFTFKYYWQDDKRAQAAFQEWTFDCEAILGCAFDNNVIWLVIDQNDGCYLEKMDFESGIEDGTTGYQVHLDRKQELTGTYSSSTNITSFDTGWDSADTHSYQVVRWDGAVFATTTLDNTGATTIVKVAGNLTDGAKKCWVGVPYTMTHELSELYIKDQKGLVVQSGRTMLRKFHVNFSNTGYFQATVSSPGRDDFTYTFSGKTLGTSDLVLGTAPAMTGIWSFGLHAESKGTSITFTNTSPLPSAFLAGEWEAEWVMQSRRMG